MKNNPKGKSNKKLLFVTGTRADFGKLKPLASEALNNGFKVIFFVTGMHMLSKYGATKEEIRSCEGFETIEFLNQRDGDPQDIILSKTILGFSDYVNEINPDLVIIHGDRLEALACSIVCATNYYLSVHIEGGEVSGTIDELFRHCNSKLCNIHMVSSEKAKKRVVQLGEPEKNIFVLGSPELDIHSNDSGVHIDEVKKRYDINFKEYGICIFHPVTSEIDSIEGQAKSLFEALEITNKNFVLILPNNDPGNKLIKKKISELNKRKFKILPSMRFNYFSELIKNCSIFVGNSSTGVREVPFLGICSLDIGSRQYRRSNSNSIFSVSPYDKEKIIDIINDNWNKKFSKSLHYGKGNASEKFVEILLKEDIWKNTLQKIFRDQ
tara:strand:+ start:313 stop:1455 length:1143 start_codon:yes stop_codon:yes gene_type:complete